MIEEVLEFNNHLAGGKAAKWMPFLKYTLELKSPVFIKKTKRPLFCKNNEILKKCESKKRISNFCLKSYLDAANWFV